MEKKIVHSEKAPKAVGTYSQGVKFGDVCYFSGMLGLDPQTGTLATTFDGQLSQILKNIDGLLESQGLKRSDIIKSTIFMTDLADFPKVNKAYEEFFATPYPARSCVQVSALPRGAVIEIEVIAG